jgi:flagellar biosynthesis protein FliR
MQALTFTNVDINAMLVAWLWPFLRVSAAVMAAPVFGNRVVPARVKLGIALLLTLLIAPVAPPMPPTDPFSARGFIISAQQVLVGVIFGFALRLVFAVMEVGGQLVAHLTGLGFASLVDPQNGVDVPVVSHFYVMLATLLFLGLDGHLIAVRVLAESFAVLPVGPDGVGRAGLWHVSGQAGWIFASALLMALPAMAALLTVNLAFGVMTRAAPQLNIFTVGFPVTLLFGFVIIWLTLPGVLLYFQEVLDLGVNFAEAVFHGAP